ncbi:MAG: M28 family metallopeptidase [Promethearchaeota archaeon]
MKVDDSYIEYAYNLIKYICEEFGPRYSSSEAEKKANLWIKNEFSKFCDETYIEEFETHPELYPQGIFKLTGLFAAIAFIFMPFIFPFPILSAILIFIGLFILFSELFYMKRWIKFLFKKGVSSNVFGIIKPLEEVKFRIIFEGHIDSAKQMRIAEYEKLPLKRFIIGILYLPFTIIMAFVKFFALLSLNRNFWDTGIIQFEYGLFQWTIIDWIYFLAWFILYPCFIFLIRGLTGDIVIPGASDNLSGLAVTAAVGKYISQDQHRPKNVEIIIASMGSEEIGDRGAKYFVEHHGDLLKKSYAYVIDDVGTGNKFYIIEKDFMHRATYSQEVINRMEKAHKTYKKETPNANPIGKRKIPLGSSDACMYIKGGYKASFIIGVQELESDNKKISKPPNWHSTRDTWQNISKKMLQDGIGIALKFIELVDKEYEK